MRPPWLPPSCPQPQSSVSAPYHGANKTSALCPLPGWHHLKPSSLQCLEHPARTGDLIKASTVHTVGHAILGTTREVVIYLFPHLTYRLVPEWVSGSAQGSTRIPPQVRVTSKQHMGFCNCSGLSPELLCGGARFLAVSIPLGEPGRPQRSAGHT